jgi:hypothetical protein
MRVGQLFDGFGFKENFVPHDEAGVLRIRQDDSLVAVADFMALLARECNSSLTQFND